jgi:DNA-binding MarR family transcriptional regulator
MRRMRPHDDRALAQMALGAKQYNLPSQIEQVRPVTRHVLGASMALDSSTLGRNLRPLLAQHRVEVGPGADARTKLVSLTQAGKAKLADGHAQWQRANEQVGALLGTDLSPDPHGVAERCLPRLGMAPDGGAVGPSRRRP